MKTAPSQTMCTHQNQKGAVLAIGLMMLLILTILGVTAMKSTVLDERIAANSQFKMLAFQAAESALVELGNFNSVEAYLNSGGGEDYAVGTRTYAVGDGTKEASVDVVLNDGGFLPYTGTSLGEGGSGLRMQVFIFTASAELEETRAIAVHNLSVGRLVPKIEGQ